MQDFQDTIQVDRQPYIARGLDQQGRYPEVAEIDDEIELLTVWEVILRLMIWLSSPALVLYLAYRAFA